jgi:hypothetical protein
LKPSSRNQQYGIGVLGTSLKYFLEKLGVLHFRLFNADGRKLVSDYYSPACPQAVLHPNQDSSLGSDQE